MNNSLLGYFNFQVLRSQETDNNGRD